MGRFADIYMGCSTGTIHIDVTVVSSDGATASDSYDVDVLPGPCDGLANNNKGINESPSYFFPIAEENNFSVYPNPVSGMLTIQIPEEEEDNITVDLLDAQGKMVKINKAVNGQTINMTLKGLPDGMYLLKLGTKNGTLTKKIIKGIQ